MIHTTTARVRYAETDQGGVVYHATYLYWFEIGRTELMRTTGFPYGEFERQRGLLLQVVEAHLDYRHPARYDDVVRIESWLTHFRRVQFTVNHRILRDSDGSMLAEGYIRLGCVDATGRVRAIPDDVRLALSKWVAVENVGKPAARSHV